MRPPWNVVDDGCDSAQGNFFSRPCEADKLATWLAESEFGALSAVSASDSEGAKHEDRLPCLPTRH